MKIAIYQNYARKAIHNQKLEYEELKATECQHFKYLNV
jgi:hypothetical protein